MSKSLHYEFQALCGVAYDCGDIRFTSDNLSLLSPVGHRLTRFGLSSGGTDAAATTYAFESLSPLRRVAVSATCLVVIDEAGRGLVCNPGSGAVLHRFKTEPCSRVEFSPDGTHLVIAAGRKIQLWRLPYPLNKSISMLVLEHEFAAHSMDITCLEWFSDGVAFLSGSEDCSVRIHQVVENAPLSEHSVALVGHKSRLIGVFPIDQSEDQPCIFSVAQDGAVFEWRFKERPEPVGKQRAKRRRPVLDSSEEWSLANRHFTLVGNEAMVTCAASTRSNYLLLGFSNGVFSLYEIPTMQKVQTLSASKFALESAAISRDGAWLALGSPTMGQLLVWEWLSETFVLKQQGHYYALNCVAYSPDGRLTATGGDDGKVKVWSTATNTGFVTFTEHEGAVTSICFASNTVLVSCSLDGTCRAFDMVRLRNFRTMTAPTPCQLSSVAISDAEIICAGAIEPPNIYMWSLRTGKLLDTLSGHTGPVSSLDFSSARPVLASASWDGTIKLWEPFTSTKPVESLVQSRSDTAAPVNQLCVAFRPDGKALVSAGLDGSISLWSVDEGTLKVAIDCRRDLGVTDKINAHFTSLCFSADGRVLLAGGKSSWVYAYDLERELLLKKYSLGHRVRELGEEQDEDADDARKRRWRESRHLPGVTRGKDAGKRATMNPDVTSACLRFSPTGRSWAAATPLGLMVFSLDASVAFEPVDLFEECTPQSARRAGARGEFAKALTQALFLGEPDLIDEIIGTVPLDALGLVVRGVPRAQLARTFEAIAKRLETSTALQYNLEWALALFSRLSEADVERFRPKLLPSFRSVQRAVVRQERQLSRACDENMYDLEHILGMRE